MREFGERVRRSLLVALVAEGAEADDDDDDDDNDVHASATDVTARRSQMMMRV